MNYLTSQEIKVILYDHILPFVGSLVAVWLLWVLIGPIPHIWATILIAIALSYNILGENLNEKR